MAVVILVFVVGVVMTVVVVVVCLVVVDGGMVDTVVFEGGEGVTLKCIDNPTASPIDENNKIIDSIHHFFLINFRMNISRLER